VKSYLFVYGTLKDPSIRKKILGYETQLIPASIKGFRRSTVMLSGVEYPILIEDPERKETIEGGYFELLEHDLEKLDAYESDAYRRDLYRLENGIMSWLYHR
jgi:gamma-glutamylcyclotransferase (GGCT)/AIG2-like uncharacterized protein YtfP